MLLHERLDVFDIKYITSADYVMASCGRHYKRGNQNSYYLSVHT